MKNPTTKPPIFAELSWTEYYLWLAMAASVRSKDPSSHVGAVVVKGSSVVTGYNGFPKGVQDLKHRWERPTKYDFVAHAERNALDNANFDVTGAKIYVTHYPPCNECAKSIIQRGISEVICGDWILSANTLEQSEKSFLMLSEARIQITSVPATRIYMKAMKIIKENIETHRGMKHGK